MLNRKIIETFYFIKFCPIEKHNIFYFPFDFEAFVPNTKNKPISFCLVTHLEEILLARKLLFLTFIYIY